MCSSQRPKEVIIRKLKTMLVAAVAALSVAVAAPAAVQAHAATPAEAKPVAEFWIDYHNVWNTPGLPGLQPTQTVDCFSNPDWPGVIFNCHVVSRGDNYLNGVIWSADYSGGNGFQYMPGAVNGKTGTCHRWISVIHYSNETWTAHQGNSLNPSGKWWCYTS
jgi:hypothetical protein